MEYNNNSTVVKNLDDRKSAEAYIERKKCIRIVDGVQYNKRRHDSMMDDMNTKIIKLEENINLKNDAIDLLNMDTVHEIVDETFVMRPQRQFPELIIQLEDISRSQPTAQQTNIPQPNENSSVNENEDSPPISPQHVPDATIQLQDIPRPTTQPTQHQQATISHEKNMSSSTRSNHDSLLKDGIAEYLTYMETSVGRHYTCGVFLSDATVKLLLALNRGNKEFRSAKYDLKFATALINEICESATSTDENVLRNFINGNYQFAFFLKFIRIGMKRAKSQFL